MLPIPAPPVDTPCPSCGHPLIEWHRVDPSAPPIGTHERRRCYLCPCAITLDMATLGLGNGDRRD